MNKNQYILVPTFIIQKDLKYAMIMFIISILAPLCSHGDIAQHESTHSHLFHCHDQSKEQLTKSILIFQGLLKSVEAVLSSLTIRILKILYCGEYSFISTATGLTL